jgi:hypothetical protein
MVIPPPDHSYFVPLAQRLGPVISQAWWGVSLLSAVGLILALLYIVAKAPRPIRFYALFIFIALLPVIPLNYKVTSRNIYIPSFGLAVLAGYYLDILIERMKGARLGRHLVYLALGGYMAISVAANWTASLEYRKHQTIVAGMIEDLRDSGRDFTKYDYVFLDHMPGRAIVGPAMIYKLGYNREVIASNDPVFGPIDIPAAVEEIRRKGAPYAVFDYRDGHLVDITDDFNKP